MGGGKGRRERGEEKGERGKEKRRICVGRIVGTI